MMTVDEPMAVPCRSVIARKENVADDPWDAWIHVRDVAFVDLTASNRVLYVIRLQLHHFVAFFDVFTSFVNVKNVTVFQAPEGFTFVSGAARAVFS
jgi:hypothetical protein